MSQHLQNIQPLSFPPRQKHLQINLMAKQPPKKMFLASANRESNYSLKTTDQKSPSESPSEMLLYLPPSSIKCNFLNTNQRNGNFPAIYNQNLASQKFTPSFPQNYYKENIKPHMHHVTPIQYHQTIPMTPCVTPIPYHQTTPNSAVYTFDSPVNSLFKPTQNGSRSILVHSSPARKKKSSPAKYSLPKSSLDTKKTSQKKHRKPQQLFNSPGQGGDDRNQSPFLPRTKDGRLVETTNLPRAVRAIDSSGNHARIFSSCSNAAREMNINRTRLSRLCRKGGGFIGEYTYKYVDIASVKKQPNANEFDPSVLFATDILLELKLSCVSPRSRI